MFQSFNFSTSDFLFDFHLFFQAQNNEKEDNNEKKVRSEKIKGLKNKGIENIINKR